MSGQISWEVLMLRLARGVAKLDAARVQKSLDFIYSQRMSDGGFRGRRGPSDLYYTSFALRTLALVGETNCETLPFILSKRNEIFRESIDALSMATCAIFLNVDSLENSDASSDAREVENLAAWLERQLAPMMHVSGGLQTSREAITWSTYLTFLWGVIATMLGETPPRISYNEISARRREDGGFVELAPLKRSGTNPTAAALGIAESVAIGGEIACNDFSPEEFLLWKQNAIAFLAAQQLSGGGFRAHTQIPVADLLSTFTALVTLDRFGGLGTISPAAALTFAHQCRTDSGGYCGGLWDTSADTEYTFYGLAIEAMLTEM